MTRRLGLGANVRLIRVAGTVRRTVTWVFLPLGYTSQLGIRVSIRRCFLARLACSPPPAVHCAEITASLVLEHCP